MAQPPSKPPQSEGPAFARQQIAEVFDTALSQRSKFHLEFDKSVTSLTNLGGSLLDFNAQALRLELTGLRAVPESWAGASLTCYFRITDRANRSAHVFYSFDTSIRKIEQKSEGVAVLTLACPAVLSRSQRRQSMRVNTDLRHFAVLSFWVYGQNGFDMDSPFLTLEPLARKQARVDNLSAGGMRLVLTGAFVRASKAQVDKGTRFIVQMHIRNLENGQEDPYWLIARISNSVRDFVSKDVVLGLEFIAEGRLDPETRKVGWKKVQGNVIPGIGKWTYKWNLDVYREKGLSNA